MPTDIDGDPKDRKPRKIPRQEFEVAYYTKELGRPLQRQILERQLAAFSAAGRAAASHHDDAVPEVDGSPPQDDRAG